MLLASSSFSFFLLQFHHLIFVPFLTSLFLFALFSNVFPVAFFLRSNHGGLCAAPKPQQEILETFFHQRSSFTPKFLPRTDDFIS
jgi:hypothetical protein